MALLSQDICSLGTLRGFGFGLVRNMIVKKGNDNSLLFEVKG